MSTLVGEPTVKLSSLVALQHQLCSITSTATQLAVLAFGLAGLWCQVMARIAGSSTELTLVRHHAAAPITSSSPASIAATAAAKTKANRQAGTSIAADRPQSVCQVGLEPLPSIVCRLDVKRKRPAHSESSRISASVLCIRLINPFLAGCFDKR